MTAYYNEFDPFAAAWLRELIKDGLIADGIVDERSISDVQPKDLEGFTQCHFFAGIGGWSAAARLAGWDDERPMWTGSPPCQPFSTAGNRKGQDDERHLWPVFFDLIRECAPPVVFGEQVAAAIRTGWFDDLQNDMEAEGYASAMAVLPACSVGAPHKRDRLFYVAERVADAQCDLSRDIARDNEEAKRIQKAQCQSEHGSDVPDRCGPGDAQQGICTGDGLQGRRKSSMADADSPQREGKWLSRGVDKKHTSFGSGSASNSGLANTNDSGQPGQGKLRRSSYTAEDEDREVNRVVEADTLSNFWAGSEYIYCRDGKERQIPTEPALFPLAHGLPNRVGTLRGAGNAIVPQVAAEIIKAYMG